MTQAHQPQITIASRCCRETGPNICSHVSDGRKGHWHGASSLCVVPGGRRQQAESRSCRDPLRLGVCSYFQMSRKAPRENSAGSGG